MQKNVLSLAPSPVDRFADIPVSGLSEAEQKSLVKLALLVTQKRHRPGHILEGMHAARDFLRLLLCEHKNEVFGAIFLDVRHRILCTETLFLGTIDGASVHPRVVLQKVMECNAAAVIFYGYPDLAVDLPRMLFVLKIGKQC